MGLHLKEVIFPFFVMMVLAGGYRMRGGSKFRREAPEIKEVVKAEEETGQKVETTALATTEENKKGDVVEIEKMSGPGRGRTTLVLVNMIHDSVNTEAVKRSRRIKGTHNWVEAEFPMRKEKKESFFRRGTPPPKIIEPYENNAEPTVTLGYSGGPYNPNGPHFDDDVLKNVTSLVGKSAFLVCRVRNLGNKTVSWIRHRDIHILTVGRYTYTSDQRFQTTHHIESDEWTLQVKWAQKRDAGVYECQISTQPVQSFYINLNLRVPEAKILGGPDLHVHRGSTINLTCTVRLGPEPPAYIFWYHHKDVISYDSSRGGVTVITERGEVSTSYLLIQHADIPDSGKYSCCPSNADIATIQVHVLYGENPAAMQTESGGSIAKCSAGLLAFVILMYLFSTYTLYHLNLAFRRVR